MTPSEIRHKFSAAAANYPGQLLAQISAATDAHPKDLVVIETALRALEAEGKTSHLHYQTAPPRKP
jgi:hypothetical protein